MSSLLPSMNGDDHEGATLCPTHYKQVKECINILKGEQKGFIPYKKVPSGYGDVPLIKWGASGECPLWMMVNGVKFVPEKPKEEWVAINDGFGYTMTCYATGMSYPIGTAEVDALYNQMRRERGED